MDFLKKETDNRLQSKTQINQIVKLAYAVLDDRQAEDIKIIDISEISILADYFIIVHGRNTSHIDALVNHVDQKLSEAGVTPKHIEYSSDNGWVLMDYSNVIIHIFSEQDRKFYELERIWADGKQIDDVNSLS
ncbi:ribosome silencing factor [Clostridiales bacterium COT073_COT-073]|nr:ribosome silencing factor [Clostridiales bacterium COT073_COT-073]